MSFRILLLLLIPFSVSAQFKGRVVSITQTAVPYALVLLTDSNNLIVKGTITDSSGRFELAAPAKAFRFIQITSLGYDTLLLRADTLLPATNLGNIVLSERKVKLKTAEVVSIRPVLQFMADKTVMNVADNPVAAGNMIFDLLRKCPGVTVNQSDQFLLRGQPAQIWFNNRKSDREGQSLTDYLKTTPADILESIEVISSPSSKYDAQGVSGIIKLIFLKNKENGFNGQCRSTIGYGRYLKASEAVSLNYKDDKFAVFAEADAGYYRSFNALTYNSKIQQQTAIIQLDRSNYWNPTTRMIEFSAGADFMPDKKTIIGIRTQSQIDNQQENNTNNSQFLIPGDSPYLTVDSKQSQTSKNMNYAVNFNLSRETDTVGSVFTADIDLVGYTSDADEINNNIFTDSLGYEVRSPYLFRNQTPIEVKIFSARVDYKFVTDSSFFFETGIKASHVKNNNTFLADTGYAGLWMPDYNRTNQFIYTETIGAAYAQANKSFKKLTLQAGVRAELTDYEAHSVTTGQRDKKTYLSVFPTLFTLYPVDSANVLSFSYTRRIGRPSYQSLNPFSWYIDPFTQFSGNPFLRPSFSHNAELKWAYRERLFTSFSYSYSTKITDNVIIQQAATQTTTNLTANIGYSHFAGINVSRTFMLSSFCSADFLVSGSVSKIVSDYPGYSFNRLGWYGEMDADFTFLLPKEFKLVSSLYYTTPSQNGIMKIRSNYGLSLVLRHSFSNSRGSLSLRLNNIIGQNAFRAHVVNEDLDIVWENQWEARRIMLSFTWKFGRKTVKEKREHDGAAQDERNRVNTN